MIEVIDINIERQAVYEYIAGTVKLQSTDPAREDLKGKVFGFCWVFIVEGADTIRFNLFRHPSHPMNEVVAEASTEICRILRNFVIDTVYEAQR